jgi:hypothetical protein
MLRLSLYLLLLISHLVCAAAMPPQGVWRGTLGAKAIMACFNESLGTTAYASYYYIDHLKPIVLTTREADAFWHEENDTGRWTLDAPLNGSIAGSWIHPKTKNTLPIQLYVVDGRNDKTACARDSYNVRLEMSPKLRALPRVQFSVGRAYRKLQFAGQESVELFGPDVAISAINGALKLDQSQAAIDAYFQQRANFSAAWDFRL